MDLFEVEGKKLFNKYNIPTEEIKFIDATDIDKLSYPVVLKGQYLSGKRGKAGAIKVVNSKEELLKVAEDIKKIAINGNYPSNIHIAPFVKVEKEHYCGFTLDRKNKSFMLIYADEGGINIEELAKEGKLVQESVNDDIIQEVANKVANNSVCLKKDVLKNIILNLWKIVKECDCTTVEINPIGEKADGDLVCMDSKVVIDDNAWYRQQANVELLLERNKVKTVYEEEAEKYNLAFVNLDDNGTIGVIAGGAGIGMATVDSINYYGLKPFNFCDLGGGVTAEKTYNAVKMLLSIPELEGILINIFGGINNCLNMAEGICRAYDEVKSDKKLVVKSRGFNQEEGWKLYDERNIAQVRYGTTDDAVKKLKKLLEEK